LALAGLVGTFPEPLDGRRWAPTHEAPSLVDRQSLARTTEWRVRFDQRAGESGTNQYLSIIIVVAFMRAVDIIVRKRDGLALTREAIDIFVNGVTDGTWPDYQAAALLMAIVLNGMTQEETWWLTESMLHSGTRLDLSDIPGPKIGKHSTGGVGDKVSIVLAPVAAACGVIVPKLSGRGLGHTGGTLDKLESIPGFRVNLTLDEFKHTLRQVGTCIIGQTAQLVPADKTIYSLRDVTGTVESVPLVAASIMSKKLAEGTSALVLDIKCGSGAITTDLPRARALAEMMVALGHRARLPVEAVITDMAAPLGRSVGNVLELIECFDTLKGNGPSDLVEVVHRLASRMLVLAGLARTDQTAQEAVSDVIQSGRALDTMRRLIHTQGGDVRVVDDYSRLPAAPHCASLMAERSGYVTRLDARQIGRASHALGAGRLRVDSPIDHGVGVVIKVKRGDAVGKGEALLDIRHRNGHGLDAARALCRSAIEIGDGPLARTPTILEELR
jgi:pyrimidine-nucleoside phosphorylase